MNFAFFFKREKFGYLMLLLSNFEIALLLGLRWFLSGYFPSSNLYESLLFLTWCLTFIQICFPFWSTPSGRDRSFVGGFLLMNQVTAPISLFLNAFASLNVPKSMGKIQPLVPALKSNWLIMHVSVMILSYAALLIGSVLAILYCILTFSETFFQSPLYSALWKIEPSSPSSFNVNAPLWSMQQCEDDGTLFQSHSESTKDSSVSTTNLLWPNRSHMGVQTTPQSEGALPMIDRLSYECIRIGFPLLTLGIVSGSVWANEAWGSFWNWDIKETWSLITWLVYAFYIHSRLQFRWQGQPSAVVASLGFFVVAICYLGVNLIGTGRHSYGWLTEASG